MYRDIEQSDAPEQMQSMLRKIEEVIDFTSEETPRFLTIWGIDNTKLVCDDHPILKDKSFADDELFHTLVTIACSDKVEAIALGLPVRELVLDANDDIDKVDEIIREDPDAVSDLMIFVSYETRTKCYLAKGIIQTIGGSVTDESYISHWDVCEDSEHDDAVGEKIKHACENVGGIFRQAAELTQKVSNE